MGTGVAEGVTLLAAYVTEPLGRALMQGRSSSDPCTDYAASTHFVCDAFATVAKATPQPAPLCYRNLTGKFGLAEQFPEWRALQQPDACAGIGFVTGAVCIASSAAAPFDPALHGGTHGAFAVAERSGDELKWVAQEGADVVEFRSDELSEHGWHRTLVHLADFPNGGGSFGLPPMATVEVEAVKEAGEWTAHGVTGAVRLWCVRVKFDVDRLG